MGGAALAGCIGFDSSPLRTPCLQGSTVGCVCDDRSAGTALCLADGEIGGCECTGADGDVSGAGAGGTPGGVTAGTAEPPMSGAGGVAGGGTAAVGGTGGAPADGGPPSDAGAGVDAGIDAASDMDAAVDPMPLSDLHTPCATNADCEGGLICAPIDTGTGMPAGYCTQECLAPTDCIQPSSGTAGAACLGGQCLLQCGFGVTCPDGMMCLIFLPVAGFCHF